MVGPDTVVATGDITVIETAVMITENEPIR